MASHDRRPVRHSQLWMGYGLVLAVVVFGATAITAQFQHADMRAAAAGQAREIAALKASQSHDRARIKQLGEVNAQQDQTLTLQQQDMRMQQQAIHRLASLQRRGSRTLAGLHDELAASHASGAQVRQRLEQLEQNNAAAKATINEAGQGKP